MANSCDRYDLKQILTNIRKHIHDIAIETGFEENEILPKEEEPRDDTKYLWIDNVKVTHQTIENDNVAQQYKRSKDWKVSFDVVASKMNEDDITEFINLVGRKEFQNYNDNPYMKYWFKLESEDLSNAYLVDRKEKVIIKLSVTSYEF